MHTKARDLDVIGATYWGKCRITNLSTSFETSISVVTEKSHVVGMILYWENYTSNR